MADVSTVKQDPIWPELQDMFGQWLKDTFYEYNGWQESFPSELSPDVSQTLLPAVWGSWTKNGGLGMDFLHSYLSGGYQPNPDINQAYKTSMYWGGPAGMGTKYMNNMAQYGGTGGPGNTAMTNLLTTGTPSQAGNPVLDMSRYGATGEWGNALASRAYGGPSGAQLALQQFLLAPTRNRANMPAPTPFKWS